MSSILVAKHLCVTKVSLQCDFRSKVQHLQRDLHQEVQHLMMLSIRGVGLLFPFVILCSSSLLQNLMLCLDKFDNSDVPIVGSQLANQRPSISFDSIIKVDVGRGQAQ